MFKMDLPYPPSINNYYGRRNGGGVYMKPEGVKFRADVVALIAKEMPDFKGIEGDLKVEVLIYLPDNGRRDADNVLKALFDSLTHAGVYKDDCKIFDMRVVKVRNPEKKKRCGWVHVKVEPIT